MGDLSSMKVFKSREALLHNHGSLLLIEVLSLNDEVKEFTSFTIPETSRVFCLTQSRGNISIATPIFHTAL
jgi:hypothetical protein